jgi:hypothetical protein
LWAGWIASNLPARPMSSSNFLTRTLWILPLVLQAAVAFTMGRRRLIRIFPIFFAYTLIVLAREGSLLLLKYPSNLYAIVYWSGETLAVLLGLGVIVETLRHVLPPYWFPKILSKSLWVLGTAAAATALALLVITHGGPSADRIFEFIILLERSARFLQASLLIVVIALISRLGLTWHHYSVGIVAGFGVYSALALVLLEFRAHLHIISDPLLVLLNSMAYNVAALIWAYYFLRKWRGTAVHYLPHTDLREWNETVTDYVDQWHRRY